MIDLLRLFTGECSHLHWRMGRLVVRSREVLLLSMEQILIMTN